MLNDTLEDLLVARVPDIDLLAPGMACRMGKGFLGRAAEELKRSIQSAQHIDGRRMHLAMHDDVARARKVVAHIGAAYRCARYGVRALLNTRR